MVQVHYVYILRSQRNGRFYTGVTEDVARRLEQHNAGGVKATKYIRPMDIVHLEEYSDATQARKREYYIKAQKSRRFIEQLMVGD